MSKQFEIARIKELPEVLIHDGIKVEIDPHNLPTVVLEEKTLELYHDALNKKKSIWTRIGAFLRAENQAGRIAKIVKDFGLMFVPFGEQIGSLTHLVTRLFINEEQKQTLNIMKQENIFQKILRFLGQQTTRYGIAVLVAIIGTLFGVTIEAGELTDLLVTIVTGIAGVYASIKALIDIFKDEDKLG